MKIEKLLSLVVVVHTETFAIVLAGRYPVDVGHQSVRAESEIDTNQLGWLGIWVDKVGS